MDEEVKMAFSIEKDLADELLEQGIAEIVFRKQKQTFRLFQKCGVELLQAEQEESEDPSSIEKDKHDFRRLMKDEGIHSLEKRDMLSSLGEDFFKRTGIGKYLPVLQTAVGVADIAINAANYRAISKHLNSQDQKLDDLSDFLNTSCQLQLKEMRGLESRLGTQLQQQKNVLMNITTKIDAIAKNQLNEIVGKYDKLIMRYNSLADKFESNIVPDLDVVEAVVMDMRAFLKEISLNVGSHDEGKEILLNLIVGMIPSYARLSVEYFKAFYMNEKRLPKNYEMMISVYDELTSEEYLKVLLDYYILNRGLHCLEAQDEVDGFSFLCLKCKAETEDELKLQIEMQKKHSEYEDVVSRYEIIIKDSIQKRTRDDKLLLESAVQCSNESKSAQA